MSTPEYITVRAMIDTAIKWATGRPATQQAYLMIHDIAELHQPAQPPAAVPEGMEYRPFCIHCKKGLPLPNDAGYPQPTDTEKPRLKFFGRKP